MKKITAIVIAIIMVLTMTACNGNEEKTTTTESTTTSEETSTTESTTTSEETSTTEITTTAEKSASELYELIKDEWDYDSIYYEVIDYIKKHEPDEDAKQLFEGDETIWPLTENASLVLINPQRILYLREYDNNGFIDENIEIYSNIDNRFTSDSAAVPRFIEGEIYDITAISDMTYRWGTFYHYGEDVYNIGELYRICGFFNDGTYNNIILIYNGKIMLIREKNHVFTEKILANDCRYGEITVHGRSIIYLDSYRRIIQMDINENDVSTKVVSENVLYLNSYGEYKHRENGDIYTPEYYINDKGEKVPWEWKRG